MPTVPTITLQPNGPRPPSPTQKANILAILGAAAASHRHSIGEVDDLAEVGVFPIVTTDNASPARHQAIQVGQFALTGQYGTRKLWVCVHGFGANTIWSLVMDSNTEKVSFDEGVFGPDSPYIFTLTPTVGSGGTVYSATLPFAGLGRYVVKVKGIMPTPSPFNSFTFGRLDNAAGLTFGQLLNGIDGLAPFQNAATDHASQHSKVLFAFHGILPQHQGAAMHLHIGENDASPIQVYGSTGHGDVIVNFQIEFTKTA